MEAHRRTFNCCLIEWQTTFFKMLYLIRRFEEAENTWARCKCIKHDGGGFGKISVKLKWLISKAIENTTSRHVSTFAGVIEMVQR